MLLPTTLSLAMLSSLSFGDTPQPAVASAHVEASEVREHPWDLVEAKDGSFFVLRNEPDSWPTVMIDRFDASGSKQWTHHHQIARAGSGAGFTRVTATAVDAQGHLYFGYDSKLNHGSYLVKMNAEHEVVWEEYLVKCKGIRQILPTRKFGVHDVVAVCGTNGIGVQVSRRAGHDGSEMWRMRNDPGTVAESGHQAALTKTDDLYVVVHWTGMRTDDNSRGTAAYKIAADGTTKWRRSWDYPGQYLDDPTPRAIAAYPDREGGVLAVFAMRHAKTLEVHKLDGYGHRVGRHRLTTHGRTLSEDSTISTQHNRINDEITIAWDDVHDGDPATEIGIAVVDFDLRAPASGKKRRTRTHKTPTPAVWKGRDVRITRIDSSDHDALVDVEVGDDGGIHLAAVDRDGDFDYLRVTTLARSANAGYASTRYRRSGHNARPTHLLRSEATGRMHVIGIDDAVAGEFISHQANLLRLVVWSDGSKHVTVAPSTVPRRPRPVRRSNAARPTARRAR